jgi:hypothetical protein
MHFDVPNSWTLITRRKMFIPVRASMANEDPLEKLVDLWIVAFTV